MSLLTWIEPGLGILLFGLLAVVAVWFIDRDRTERTDRPSSAEDTITMEFFRTLNRPPAAVLPDVVPDEPGWDHLARNWTDQTGSFKALIALDKE
jgi:hypothetical protein